MCSLRPQSAYNIVRIYAAMLPWHASELHPPHKKTVNTKRYSNVFTTPLSARERSMSAAKKCKIDFSSMVAGSREVLADVKKIDTKVGEVTGTIMEYRCKDDSERYNRLFARCSSETLEALLIAMQTRFGACRLSSSCDPVGAQNVSS